MNNPKCPTKEEISKVILDAYNSLEDKNIFTAKWFKEEKLGQHHVLKHFGTWNNMLVELNLPVIKKTNIPVVSITREEVIKDCKKILSDSSDKGRNYYFKNSNYTRHHVKTLFGGYNKLLLAAGMDVNTNRPYNYSEEDILEDLRRIYKEYGYITATLQRKISKFSQPIVDATFGSFTQALIKAGIPINDGKSVTNEQIIESLKKIYKEFGFVSTRLIEEFCIVSMPTVINRFGGIKLACDCADIPYEYDLSKLSKTVAKIGFKVFRSSCSYDQKFSWLVNPDTNKSLKIDLFFPEYGVAIEVDGEQHTKYVENFHKNKKKFEYNQKLDEVKNKLLKEHNVPLIRIPYYYSVNEIEIILQDFKDKHSPVL